MPRPASRPVAIWFIDRRGAYYQLLVKCERRKYRVNPYSKIQADHLMGMPVHCWGAIELRNRVHELVEEGWSPERIESVFPIQESGIWVQMSDGNHRRLEEV